MTIIRSIFPTVAAQGGTVSGLETSISRCDVYSVWNRHLFATDREMPVSFFSLMLGDAENLRAAGRIRTARNYEMALRSLKKFCGQRDLPVREVTANLLMQYETWLRANGAVLNTVSFYMRIMRAVYNRAVENGLAGQQRQFSRVYTGVRQTAKRAVGFSEIKAVKRLDLPPGSSLEFARDMFMFSFYTRGMAFVDIAFLRKSDLRNGVLTYTRRKTGQTLRVKWEKCMQQIAERHPAGCGSPYLLPIIKPSDAAGEYTMYSSAQRRVNRNLKRVAELCGMPGTLTMYVSRHSWASIAYERGIPLSIISEGMGHDSEKTTRIYLASLDNTKIDKANRKVLKGL